MAARRLSRCLVVLAATSFGCKGKPPSGGAHSELIPAMGPVTVRPIAAVDLRGKTVRLDDALLTAKIQGMLVEAAIFTPPDGKRAAVLTTVEVQPFVEGSADALEIGIRLHLRMTLRPEGGAEPRFNEDTVGVGQAPLGSADLGQAKAAFERLAERVAGDLIKGYVGRQKLWSGSVRDVAVALGSADVDLRVEALRVIGARKLRELLPDVLRLLSDEDEVIRDAALGAVVLLKDRSAVRALAESRQMRDAREMRKVLDAIATLGGNEARDYLAFVAENHDDEEIREMAKAALGRLARSGENVRPTK